MQYWTAVKRTVFKPLARRLALWAAPELIRDPPAGAKQMPHPLAADAFRDAPEHWLELLEQAPHLMNGGMITVGAGSQGDAGFSPVADGDEASPLPPSASSAELEHAKGRSRTASDSAGAPVRASAPRPPEPALAVHPEPGRKTPFDPDAVARGSKSALDPSESHSAGSALQPDAGGPFEGQAEGRPGAGVGLDPSPTTRARGVASEPSNRSYRGSGAGRRAQAVHGQDDARPARRVPDEATPEPARSVSSRKTDEELTSPEQDGSWLHPALAGAPPDAWELTERRPADRGASEHVSFERPASPRAPDPGPSPNVGRDGSTAPSTRLKSSEASWRAQESVRAGAAAPVLPIGPADAEVIRAATATVDPWPALPDVSLEDGPSPREFAELVARWSGRARGGGL